MPTAKWVAALVFATLSDSTQAEPLGLYTSTTGTITAVDYGFYEFANGLQAGMPVAIDFATEVNTSFATMDAGSFTIQPTLYFTQFGVAAGGNYLQLQQPSSWGPEVLNRIRLQDNVRNASGELVDVFEMSAYGSTQYANTTYYMTERLEFASTTFGNLDAWSILALEHAPLLDGTMHVRRVVEGYDATFNISDMLVDVNSFNIRFDGPGAEVPAVPEPAGYALLLAGLAGMAVVRRRPRT